jgi:hypothetical protein
MTELQIIASEARPIFWDVADPEALSREAITERILKYGTWIELQRLINALDVEFPEIVPPLIDAPRSIFTPKEKNFIRHLVYAYRHTQ